MTELSTRCPYCFAKVRVKTLVCDACAVEVTGRFETPNFLELSAEQQRFATEFLLASGSLKEIARKFGISYPTVRARLDRIIECLQGAKGAAQERRAAILDAVEEKRISTHKASALLAETREDEEEEEGEESNDG